MVTQVVPVAAMGHSAHSCRRGHLIGRALDPTLLLGRAASLPPGLGVEGSQGVTDPGITAGYSCLL